MSSAAVLIRLLGPFQIVKLGEPISTRSGGKTEQLFSCLALHPKVGVRRATLVEHIWPDVPLTLANQCLNTLMHSLKAQLADALAGQPPIVRAQSYYALNLHGGVKVDVLQFESAVVAGHRLHADGSTAAAIEATPVVESSRSRRECSKSSSALLTSSI